MSDLHSGQMVQVVLGKPKDAVKKPAARDKTAPAEKEFVYVTQIVVTADEKPPTKPKKIVDRRGRPTRSDQRDPLPWRPSWRRPALGRRCPTPADAPKDRQRQPAAHPTQPPQIHSAGQLVAKLSKAGDSTVTVKVPQRNGTGPRPPGTRTVEKDHDFDFAADVQIRWQNLPKKADGKSYSNEEYQALRPATAPGYKADESDLKPGQTVSSISARSARTTSRW